jgi:hypothetical protein
MAGIARENVSRVLKDWTEHAMVSQLAGYYCLEKKDATRFVVYDHEITADRAWFRFTLMWNDASTGQKRTRAGMQVYRIEGGKLAETWLTLLGLGSAWPDVAKQERWTSKRAT